MWREGGDNDCVGGEDAACPSGGGGGGCSIAPASYDMTTGSAIAYILALLLPLIVFRIKNKKQKKSPTVAGKFDPALGIGR